VYFITSPEGLSRNICGEIMISLRSKITQSVLGYLFLHEGVQLYVNEMSRRFQVDRGNLVRKLKNLEDEGILKSQWQGNQRYYSLNPAFPLIKEYKRIIMKTVGLEALLKDNLKGLKGIKEVFLFGSYAEDKMDLSSDLDLLVIGEHNTLDLQKKIADLQKTMDREINILSLGTSEYKKKIKSDPILQSITKKKKETSTPKTASGA